MSSDLKITLLSYDEENYFKVSSDYEKHDDKEWKDVYVNFSGYCGSINPKLFVMAPDMLDAIKELLDAANASEAPKTLKELGAIGRASALLAQLGGESNDQH